MAQLGIGDTIHYLNGGSKEDPADFYGRTIIGAEINTERLRLTFEGGEQIDIWDNGWLCCEHRYMSTDDDVSSLIGGKLIRIEAKPGPVTVNEYDDCHEQVFVEVATDKGFITVVNHNEHNGYYDGFGLTITKVEAGHFQ